MSDNDLRVAVLVPGDRWKAGFGFSVSNMIAHFMASKYSGRKAIQLISVSGSMLCQVRTDLIVRGLDAEFHMGDGETVFGATHLLLLDDDMNFPPDLLNRLLKHNVPVVGCNYSRRCLPPRPTACDLEGNDCITTPESFGLQKVAHLGTGCVLLDARIFEYMNDKLGADAVPWFSFDWLQDEQGKWYQRGEDVYFFQKIRRTGVPVLLDHDLSQSIGHLGEWEYKNWQCKPPEETKP